MRVTPFAAALCVLALAAAAGCDIASKPKPAGSATATQSASAPPAIDYAPWSGGRSTVVADPVYPKHGNPGLDILHYGLQLDWAPATKTLTGTATLRVRPARDATELNLDFMPYTLDKVLVDGADVAARVSHEKLLVTTTLAADKPVTLEVRYHGTPRTTPMPSERGDSEALGLTVDHDRGLWTMQEPYGAYTWYPANDQPSDKALYDIAVTVPAGWSAIASGTPAGRDGNTFSYHSGKPVATYLTTLAVGKYTVETVEGPHGLPITYAYRAQDRALVPVLRKTPQYIAWLEKRFGPYPFESAGAVVVDSASAMETQQMITLGARAASDLTEFGNDVLHEYAHQWFGDTVTPTTWTDLWLNEGWAMYVQLLYEQDTQDHETFAALQAWLNETDQRLRTKYGPPGHPKAGLFAMSNVYICPAAMLAQINKAIGDKAFFALGRAWVQENRDTEQDRASFIAFVNEHTGRDFTKLINSWLDSSTTPR